jgi:hypothetical protein
VHWKVNLMVYIKCQPTAEDVVAISSQGHCTFAWRMSLDMNVTHRSNDHQPAFPSRAHVLPFARPIP